jgi:hypothetical protein
VVRRLRWVARAEDFGEMGSPWRKVRTGQRRRRMLTRHIAASTRPITWFTDELRRLDPQRIGNKEPRVIPLAATLPYCSALTGRPT